MMPELQAGLVNVKGNTTYETPYHTYTYNPIDSRSTQTITSFADSRVINYSPTLTLNSPGATTTKKEAISTAATASTSASQTPTTTNTPSISGGTSNPSQSSGMNIDPLTIGILAVIGVGAFILLK